MLYGNIAKDIPKKAQWLCGTNPPGGSFPEGPSVIGAVKSEGLQTRCPCRVRRHIRKG